MEGVCMSLRQETLSRESLGFMLAIDNCGRNCEHCPAHGIKQKMETAPFDDLNTRLKVVRAALKGTSVTQSRTIHAWRIGDLLDYRDRSSGETRTVADLAEIWTTSLDQPLYTVTNGTMGVKWRQEALQDLASQPQLSSQVKLTVTPYDPKFNHSNYIENVAHDVTTLWPLTSLPSLRPESLGQPRFRINVKTSEQFRLQTEAALRGILELSGVPVDIDAALANQTDVLQIKPVYDLRATDRQPLPQGAIALSSTIQTRLKPEEVRSQYQLGFRPDGSAFEVNLWAFTESNLLENGVAQRFEEWFPNG